MTRRYHANNRTHGFTLIELLITLVVGMLVISAAVSVTIASNRMFRVDRARTRMNQDLRAASDLVGADVRTAGANLPAVKDNKVGLQPIIVRNGNELEIRRSLLSTSLPVCKKINGGSGTDVAFVSNTGNSNKGKNPSCDADSRDIDGNGKPDDLEEWVAYRTNTDINPNQTVAAYIWPASDGSSGELFIYDAEDSSNQHIHKSSGKWQNDYDPDAEPYPQLYVLEMRRYQLTDEGILQLILNDDEENPLNLVNNITDFQVRAVLTNGDILEDFGSEETHLFTRIQSIEIDVQAEEQVSPDQLVARELNNRFFPRNVFNFQ